MAKLATVPKKTPAKKAPAKKSPGRPRKTPAQTKTEAQPKTATTKTGKTPPPGEAPKIAAGLSSKDIETVKAEAPPVGGIAAAAPTDAPGFDSATLAPACKVLAQFGARVAGVEIELTNDEAKILAEALAPVIDKYMPSVSSAYGEELNLLLVVALIVGGKVSEAKVEQRNRANIRAQRDGQVNDGAGANQ